MKALNKAIMISLVMAVFPSSLSAMTKAWLIGSNSSIKLNVATSSIEKTIGLRIEEGGIFLDSERSNLFILQRAGRFSSEIAVYDVKTLQRKNALNVTINPDTWDDVKLLFPDKKNIFYLRTVGDDGGEPKITVYDAISLKELNTYVTDPPTSNQLMISNAGDVLYSIVDFRKVDIFRTTDFSYQSTVDIKRYFTLGSEGGISEYGRGRLLVSEVISREPHLDRYKYIYDISSNNISKKIRISVRGTDIMMPVTNKIALHERQYLGKFKSMRIEGSYKTSGKIHIFDASAGRVVTVIKVNIEQDGRFVGHSPSEDKLYFISYGANFGNPMLHIIDLSKYIVVKTLPIPEASMSIVFFEE